MKTLGLIFCSLIWSTAYSIGKNLMQKMHPLEVSFLRHFFALVPLLIFCFWGGRISRVVQFLKSKKTSADIRIITIGVLTFFVSPYLQLKGIQLSRATDGAVMIAIEPLITVVLAVLILKERMNIAQIIAIIFALLGVFFLSDGTIEKLLDFKDQRIIGNLIFCGALICEGLYSILSKPALEKRDPVTIITLSLLVGVLLQVSFNFSNYGIERMSGLTPFIYELNLSEKISIMFLGAIGTAVGYLYWIWALKHLEVSKMAMTLYIQPVFGVLWGILFLNEHFSLANGIGFLLIFLAVFIGSILPEYRRSS